MALVMMETGHQVQAVALSAPLLQHLDRQAVVEVVDVVVVATRHAGRTAMAVMMAAVGVVAGAGVVVVVLADPVLWRRRQ